MIKPFAVDELLARARALLRRTTGLTAQADIRVGDLVLSPTKREVKRGDRVLSLTKTEFDLLELLMQEPGIVHTRDQIYESIWGYGFETGSKSLDVYIGYLRRKTEEGGESRMVFTVRGVGYVVRES
jgi:two-component system response regulator MprA